MALVALTSVVCISAIVVAVGLNLTGGLPAMVTLPAKCVDYDYGSQSVTKSTPLPLVKGWTYDTITNPGFNPSVIPNPQNEAAADYCTLNGKKISSCSGISCGLMERYCINNRRSSRYYLYNGTAGYNRLQEVCPNGCANGACRKLSDNAYVIQYSGSMSESQNITKLFYEKYPSDKYDFLYFVSEDVAGGGASFLKVSNNGSGNFLLYNFFPFDQSGSYGSGGNLKGIIKDRNGFNKQYTENYFVADPIWSFNRYFFGTIIHELMHNWGVHLPPELADANLSGIQRGHWTGYAGSWLSVDGDTKTYVEDRNGTYYFHSNCAAEPRNNDFELYAMGLKPLNEVEDKIVVLDESIPIENNLNLFSPCDNVVEIPKEYVVKSYSIQDFVDVLGTVNSASQKNYNVAFILVKANSSIPSIKEMDALNWISQKVPFSWYKSTENRSTINGIVPTDKTPPIISNVEVIKNSDSVKIKWVTNELSSSAVVYTNSTFKYTKIAPNFVVFPPNLSLTHEIIIDSSLDSNIGYYGTAGYNFTIVSIDESLNVAKKDI